MFGHIFRHEEHEREVAPEDNSELAKPNEEIVTNETEIAPEENPQLAKPIEEIVTNENSDACMSNEKVLPFEKTDVEMLDFDNSFRDDFIDCDVLSMIDKIEAQASSNNKEVCVKFANSAYNSCSSSQFKRKIPDEFKSFDTEFIPLEKMFSINENRKNNVKKKFKIQ